MLSYFSRFFFLGKERHFWFFFFGSTRGISGWENEYLFCKLIFSLVLDNQTGQFHSWSDQKKLHLVELLCFTWCWIWLIRSSASSRLPFGTVGRVCG